MTPWHVPWRPAVTGMTVEERRGKSAAIASHGSLPCPLVSTRANCVRFHDRYREGHLLNLKHVPSMTRPVSTIGGQGLILFKSTGGVPIRFLTGFLVVCIMGYEMDRDKWKELGVPMGYTLEFATLVPCDGKVAVVGGTHDGNVLV
ncbi:hypothetical protein Tco_0563645 [Tanacetum coccineum]